MSRLEGRTIWVTGASRGLGRALAEGIGALGATVALSARSHDDLVAVAGQVPSSTIHPLSVDDPEQVDEVVADILRTHGRLDGVVTCAGISPAFAPAVALELDDWHRTISVNLTGTFLCARAAGRHFAEVGGGSLVTVSSVHATRGFERLAAYQASKGGVEALTRALAVEWARHGARANVIAPGYFESDMSHGVLASERWGQKIRGRTLLGREGQPPELVGAAAFLLGDESSYVTGTTLAVDGGWTAW